MLALIASGLEDISITRAKLTWAIPFPIASSTGETQGTWVWFDALPNYLTATGIQRGLILNYGRTKLQVRRVVKNYLPSYE